MGKIILGYNKALPRSVTLLSDWPNQEINGDCCLLAKLRRVLSSRRCFEPGPILIFAKVKMAPGQEAYRGDIHFS
jgi:hypothetical protein